MNVIQPMESNIDSSRAKEIDHGTVPLKMQNVILGLPEKPGIQFGNRESVNSIKWAYEQLVSQKQLLCTVPIQVGASTTSPIFLLQNSWKNIMQIHFRNLSDIFFLKSWKWHLTFEFRSNFQQVGMATIAYVNAPMSAIPYLTGSPVTYCDTAPSYNSSPGSNGIPTNVLSHSLFNLASAIQLPHVHVMLGEKQDVQCTLNWVSPFKAAYKDVDPYGQFSIYGNLPNPADPVYDMGFIYLFVPVAMTLASGVDPNCTVRIWSHLTDVEYAGYTPDDTLI
nr:hypothetical protein [Nelson Picorna-like virus 8]